VGISVRPLVESAIRAGFDVRALDFFGDLDTKAACPGISLSERGVPFSPRPSDYWKAAHDILKDAIVYTAPLENHPSLIERFSEKMRLWGNGPSVLKNVRNPRILQDFCAKEGMAFPKTYFGRPATAPQRGLLLKPKKSGGGKDILPYNGILPPGYYLQEHVSGIPCSVTFIADGLEANVIAVTRQYIGEKWLGASGFSWCGNMVPNDLSEWQNGRLSRIVQKFTERFRLVGCVGMDFILADDIYVLEINPRLCGSMDAVEKAFDINLFDLHMRACEGDMREDFSQKKYCAKAIIYAEKSLVARNTEALLGTAVRDIPRPNLRIGEGEPLCSVVVEGSTEEGCTRNLREEVEKAKGFFYGT